MESAHHESRDQVVEVMGEQVAELLAAEWATVIERGLDVAKVHLAETEAVLQKSLETLETEQKARSEAYREVLELRGQVLGVDESTAREGDPAGGRTLHPREHPPRYVPFLLLVDVLVFSLTCF